MSNDETIILTPATQTGPETVTYMIGAPKGDGSRGKTWIIKDGGKEVARLIPSQHGWQIILDTGRTLKTPHGLTFEQAKDIIREIWA